MAPTPQLGPEFFIQARRTLAKIDSLATETQDVVSQLRELTHTLEASALVAKDSSANVETTGPQRTEIHPAAGQPTKPKLPWQPERPRIISPYSPPPAAAAKSPAAPVAPAVNYPRPERPPRPPRKKLSTEQLIMRTIAVLGSMITIIGVALGIALAIQSGLLGPLGRVILSVVLAIALLVAGYFIQRKSKATAGSDALFITSFLVSVLIVLSLVAILEWWTYPTGAIVNVAVWAGYLMVARTLSNTTLTKAMAFAGFIYLPFFVVNDPNAALITSLLPILLVISTWHNKQADTPPVAAHIRVFAGALVVEQGLLMSNFTPAETSPVTIPFIGFVLMILAGEVFFPARAPQSDERFDANSYRTLLLTLIPIVILLIVVGIVDSWWLVLTLVGATAGVVATELALKRFPDYDTQKLTPITWLCFSAVLFIALYIKFPAALTNEDFGRAAVLTLFLAGFLAVILVLERRPAYRVPVWTFWVIAALGLTYEVSAAVLGLQPEKIVNGSVQFQAVCLTLILVFALWRRAAFDSVPRELLVVFGVVGLHLYMVAVVTFVSFVFSFGSQTLLILGFVIGHASVSVTWITFAAWILLARTRLSNRMSLGAGFVLAIAAVMKLIFFDLASLSGIPQVVAFIISGIILIAIAAIRARRQPQAQSQTNNSDKYEPV